MRKRTAWLLIGGVVALALGAALVGAMVLVLRVGDGPSWTGKRYLEIQLGGEIPDQPGSELSLFFGGGGPSLPGIVEGIQYAADDPGLAGVVLRIRPLAGTGWGKVQEIRQALGRLRESGKPLYAYLEDGGNKEYYLASACPTVVAAPTALVALTGLSVQATFYRGTLDKLGVEAQFEGFGKYKNAPNQYTESSLTAPHREQLEALLDDLDSQLVEGIAAGRGLSPEEVRQRIDGGPYPAGEAKAAGLVDELMYRDELADRLGDARRTTLTTYVRSHRGIGFGAQKIAVVHVTGIIVPGEGGQDPFGGEMAGADEIARAVRQAARRSDVKAIVLRVDSPGGAGSAADAIWHAVGEAKEEKPVVTSMGDAAASGGYYVAMGTDAIVAQPATLTGSIGVYGGKLSVQGLYDKLGITREELRRGRHAAFFSTYHPWSEGERQRIRAVLRAFYDQFVEKVAKGRGRTPGEIETVAQGRVWSGAAALSNGLVDELGGLAKAVAIARERAGVPESATVQLVQLPERKGLFETLMERSSPAVRWGAPGSELLALARWAYTEQGGAVMARLPFQLSVE
jgi:protease-4